MSTVELDTANHYWEGVMNMLPAIILFGALLLISLVILTPFVLRPRHIEDYEGLFGTAIGVIAVCAIIGVPVVFGTGASISQDITMRNNYTDVQTKLNDTYGLDLSQADLKSLANEPLTQTDEDGNRIDSSEVKPGDPTYLGWVPTEKDDRVSLIELGTGNVIVNRKPVPVQLWIINNEYVLLQPQKDKTPDQLKEFSK
jgi:hypothetical protein